MNLLITGGTGMLGRHVTRAAREAGHVVRVQSRRSRPVGTSESEWAQADLATGEGIAEAVAGVDAVVHAASDPRKPDAVDIGGTRRLVEAARAAGIRHLVYVSIVGVDQIPSRYYRAKAEAERIVAAGGIPYSTLRATQFHAFVDAILSAAARIPLVLLLPTDFRLQPVAASEVANRLLRALREGPGGRLPDFGGPEVRTLGELAKTWKSARSVAKPVVRLPLPGPLAAAFRAGVNTAPDGERGVVRWAAWLRGEVAAANGPRLTGRP